jgi:hypothetical protein
VRRSEHLQVPSQQDPQSPHSIVRREAASKAAGCTANRPARAQNNLFESMTCTETTVIFPSGDGGVYLKAGTGTQQALQRIPPEGLAAQLVSERTARLFRRSAV